MISVTGTTNKYSIQPVLLEKHAKTLEWLSATMLWKSELVFYQKILDEHGPEVIMEESKREITRLESQIVYFIVEAIEDLRRKLRNHESKLAKMLDTKSEWDTEYYTEHNQIMDDALALYNKIIAFKADLKKTLHDKAYNII